MLIERAVLETLAYSDIFDYPLKIDELHRYLILTASKEDLLDAVHKMDKVDMQDGFYFLAGRKEIVHLRKMRETSSRKSFQRALFYGKTLGILPFVRMVGMTGSLAVLNLSQRADMDFMLVTQPKRLWLARAFAVTFGRFIRLFGDTICVNLLVSENALAWPTQDLYSAREMCQMIPISGADTYRQLKEANLWVQSILPNARMQTNNKMIPKSFSIFQKLLEMLFWGKLGDKLEQHLMAFQLSHITKKYGNGLEANFTVDICQGNFHDHRQWTDENFQARLNSLGLSESVQELTHSSVIS